MKKKLLISFSGGRTSAYMTWWLLNEWEDRGNWEMIVVFANTGKEHEKTLEFVERCSVEWGIDIVWVEARHKDDNGVPYSEKGWKVKHRVVDFQTASRKGEPFEEMISLLGLPSTNAPFCSKQLKKFAIESYLDSIGWSDYLTAIGIRSDEVDRVSETWRENRVTYPLIEINYTTKVLVMIWWKNQGFDLYVPEDLGNCDGCWKKSMNRLIRISKEHPNVFNWWQNMTDKYGDHNPRGVEYETIFNFYRGGLSPKDIFDLAKYKPDQLSLFIKEEKLDGCSESCEAF